MQFAVLQLIFYDYFSPFFFFFLTQAHWTEFIQLSTVRQNQRDGADSWLRSCLRYVPTNKLTSTTAVKSAKNADPAGKFCVSNI